MTRSAILGAFAAVALLAASASSGLAAAPERRTPGLSKNDIRRLPPAETRRRLRDTVWEMFEEKDLRRPRAPRRALDRLILTTRPHFAGFPGLCRYDAVTVGFRPVAGARDDAGPDTPMRATELESDARFHFLQPPSMPGHGRHGDREHSEHSAGCARLDTARADAFSAPDAETANDGMLAFLRLQEAVRARRDVPLACDLGPNETQTCEAVLLALGPASVSAVERCTAADRRADCFIVYAGDRRIEVETTGYGTPGPPAIQPVRARLQTMIVMSHEVID